MAGEEGRGNSKSVIFWWINVDMTEQATASYTGTMAKRDY